jgi:hypothetical protein
MRLHNVLKVPLSCHVALHTHQLAPASVVDSPLHHNAATTMRRCLVYTVLLVAFSNPSVQPPPSVMAMKEEAGLVRKPHASQMVPQCLMSLLSGPLQSGLVMVPGQYVAT